MNFGDYVNDNLFELKPVNLDGDENFLWKENNLWSAPVERSKLLRLIKSGFDINYNTNVNFLQWKKDFKIPYNTLQEHCMKIIVHIKPHGMFFDPSLPKTFMIGRAIYNNNNICAPACMSVDLRSYLLKDRMVDYDLKSAHQAIMVAICKKMDLQKTEYNYIEHYVNNKEDIIRKCIKKHYELTDEQIDKLSSSEFADYRNKFKNLGIVLGYGGSYKKWCDERGFLYEPVEEMELYAKQMVDITNNYIIPSNLKLYEKMNLKYKTECKKKKKNVDPNKTKRSICSKFLQHYEMLIITTLISHLIKQEKITNKQVSYEYDGFEVTKKDAEKITCEDLNILTKELTLLEGLIFTIKDKVDVFSEQIKICENIQNEELDIPEEYSLEFNTEYFKSLKLSGGYNKQKKYFERFVKFAERPQPLFYIIEELTVLNIRTQQPIRVRKINHFDENAIKKLYWRFETNIPNIFGKFEKFLKIYLEDEDRTAYKSITFTPYNEPFDPIKNNAYLNTFTGYNKVIFSDDKFDTEKRKRIIKPFENMALEVCGNKDNYDIFMNLLAHKIKYPTVKQPYAVVLQSLQGEGKNLMLDCFGYIVGKEHYLTTSNIDDIMGVHSEGLMHKLLVNLNEMDLSQTRDKKNRFKSLISEDTITFNPKNVRPFEMENYAFIVLTSNEAMPLPLDITSGERRWFVFEGSGKNLKKYSSEQWAKLADYFKKDGFIRALYEELMSLKCEEFDYARWKKLNSSTFAYKKLASYSVPMELQFLNDYIQYNNYVTDAKDQDSYVDYSDVPTEDFSKSDLFKTYVEIKCDNMRKSFNKWAVHNNWKVISEERNSKAFKNRIASGLRLRSLECTTIDRRVAFKFRPIDLMYELIEKKACEVDGNEEWMKEITEEGDKLYVEDLELEEI